MLSTFPLLRFDLATRRDGDIDHETIATCAGIPYESRGELFDLVIAKLDDLGCPDARYRLRLNVADPIVCAAASVVEMALHVAAVCAKEIEAGRKVAA